jgi:hypothetical protein
LKIKTVNAIEIGSFNVSAIVVEGKISSNKARYIIPFKVKNKINNEAFHKNQIYPRRV